MVPAPPPLYFLPVCSLALLLSSLFLHPSLIASLLFLSLFYLFFDSCTPMYVVHLNHTHSNSFLPPSRVSPTPTYGPILSTVPAAHRVQLVPLACTWVQDPVLVAFRCCDKASYPKALTEDRVYFHSWFQWNGVHHGGGGGIAAGSQSLKLRDHIFI